MSQQSDVHPNRRRNVRQSRQAGYGGHPRHRAALHAGTVHHGAVDMHELQMAMAGGDLETSPDTKK